jgi:predicted enzyme related to lactoylglutathione lyase
MDNDYEGNVMDWKIELLVIPVTDVDRAKAFYADKIGFHVDTDQAIGDNLRFVQLTPPGSACSIAIGKGITDMAPGAVRGTLIVVSDIEQARAELVKRGAEVSEIEDQPWGRFVHFSDPDGNGFSLQQLPPRG